MATAPEVVAAVIACRVELRGDGLDHGPQSIVWTLQRRGVVGVPSRATVSRILSCHGLVEPQPRKRPKSASKRFVFARPNECWQSDWTEWQLADGSPAAIAGSIDDHSRYLAGLVAGCGPRGDHEAGVVGDVGRHRRVRRALDVIVGQRICLYRPVGRYELVFEANLRALGVRTINSRPYHPQTCGKIERFWQTLKKWLALSARGQPPSPSSTINLRPIPRALQPPQAAPGAARSDPGRGIHRHREGAPGRSAPAGTGVPHSAHREPVVRQPHRPAVQGQRRVALGRTRMRHHPRRRAHRRLQRRSPGARTSPPTRPAIPTRRPNRPDLPRP